MFKLKKSFLLCSGLAVLLGNILFPSSALADTNKKIVISLSQQNLTAYNGDAVFVQSAVTTGGPETPTVMGSYQVLAKVSDFVMHSPWPQSDWRWYPDSYVHYALMFQSDGYFIHDAPWRSNFGPGSNSVLGPPGGYDTGTHGCVNVPLVTQAALYNWADIGTQVIVEP